MNRFDMGTGFMDSGFYVGAQKYTSKEAIIEAGLDWQVEKRDAFFMSNQPNDYDGIEKLENYKAIVKVDTDTVLNIATDSYHPIQNKDAFLFMDQLVSDGKMQFHSAGSFNEGRRVWMLGKISESNILPDDITENFILLYNSHDGTSSLKAIFTNIRMACTNAIRMMFNKGTNTGINVRHTMNSSDWQANALNILGAAEVEAKNFKEFATYLTTKTISDESFKKIALQLIPDPPPEIKNTRAENTRSTLLELFQTGKGTDIAGVKGTAWGAFNAVSEYSNHLKTTRGENGSVKRLQSTLFGPGSNLIEKSIAILKAA